MWCSLALKIMEELGYLTMMSASVSTNKASVTNVKMVSSTVSTRNDETIKHTRFGFLCKLVQGQEFL